MYGVPAQCVQDGEQPVVFPWRVELGLLNVQPANSNSRCEAAGARILSIAETSNTQFISAIKLTDLINHQNIQVFQ